MKAWEQFLQLQETELSQETVKKWLRSLKVIRFDACNLYLEANDTFQALWFEEHIRAKLETQLLNGNYKAIKVHLKIANSKNEADTQKGLRKKNKEKVGARFHLTFDELNPQYLINNFIATPENQVTYQLLCELAGLSENSSPWPPEFNPLYLYGPSGCGKTHLLMSLAHHFNTKGFKSLYVRAELFTDHVVSAIRASEMRMFRQAYRNADILLVDDVHVFSRKGATQEEFFHTFNALHLQGKQIVLSSTCSPQELQHIEPRLVSRFEWGIVLPVCSIEGGKVTAMLKAKAEAFKIDFPAPVLNFLAENFTSSPRASVKALEALVLRLHLDAHHSPKHLSIPSLKILLADLLNEEKKAALTPLKIIQTVSEHYDIPIEDILGKSQTRECALPRQIAMHLCREKLKLSFMKIGDFFSRDHSTVMTSVKHIQKGLKEENQDIAAGWHAVERKLRLSPNGTPGA